MSQEQQEWAAETESKTRKLTELLLFPLGLPSPGSFGSAVRGPAKERSGSQQNVQDF